MDIRLYNSILAGNLEEFKTLLIRGCSSILKSKHDLDALGLAAQQGHLPLVKYIVENRYAHNRTVPADILASLTTELF
jgi:hypothetical protein